MQDKYPQNPRKTDMCPGGKRLNDAKLLKFLGICPPEVRESGGKSSVKRSLIYVKIPMVIKA